ncbi:MAG: hypothetical protein M1821_004978 [Bathelium mastoideum]|nr:MAG: hypothetical protein M1821_004978 [Bathelium mastoideum]
MDRQVEQSSSPFLPMFETFRAELDEHHDRRERIVKASRDITAASKKIIFALQRARQVNQPLHRSVIKSNAQYWEIIKTQYANVSPDIQGQDAYRYARNITGGNQEFMESLSFQHYLETQSLISYEDACARLAELGAPDAPVSLSLEDYILGIFDMTGELMRFAITAMATSQSLPGSDLPSADVDTNAMEIELADPAPKQGKKTRRRDVMQDLRQLRSVLEGLDIDRSSPLFHDVQKKMDVMQQSVEKVEKALYGLIVRGRERPKGWMPDLKEEGLTFLAWGGNAAFDGLVAATLGHHGGKHGWDITISEARDANHWFDVSSITYAVAICITKIAVLCLYRRVFSPHRGSFFDQTIVGLMALFILYYGITVFIKIFECIPKSKITNDTGSCTHIPAVLNADGVFNTITDTVILFLPVKAVWHLRIEKQSKIVVVLVFTFGLCAPVFSVIGFIVRLKISNSPDTTWNQPMILLWALAELTTGNLCVCFPEMARLFRKSEKSRPTAHAPCGGYKLSQSPRTIRRGGKTDPDQYNVQHGEGAQYLELGEHDTYSVQIVPTQKISREDNLKGVHVTEEVAVESHVV